MVDEKVKQKMLATAACDRGFLGWTPSERRAAGWTPSALIAAGWTPSELRAAGWTPAELEQVETVAMKELEAFRREGDRRVKVKLDDALRIVAGEVLE